MRRPPPAPIPALDPPLSSDEFRRFARLTRWLPAAWVLTARRRRLLLLALAAPGFISLTTTPLHRNPAALLAGAVLFLAALAFRRLTERAFVRAEAAALWPPAPLPTSETRHA